MADLNQESSDWLVDLAALEAEIEKTHSTQRPDLANALGFTLSKVNHLWAVRPLSDPAIITKIRQAAIANPDNPFSYKNAEALAKLKGKVPDITKAVHECLDVALPRQFSTQQIKALVEWVAGGKSARDFDPAPTKRKRSKASPTGGAETPKTVGTPLESGSQNPTSEEEPQDEEETEEEENSETVEKKTPQGLTLWQRFDAALKAFRGGDLNAESPMESAHPKSGSPLEASTRGRTKAQQGQKGGGGLKINDQSLSKLRAGLGGTFLITALAFTGWYFRGGWLAELNNYLPATTAPPAPGSQFGVGGKPQAEGQNLKVEAANPTPTLAAAAPAPPIKPKLAAKPKAPAHKVSAKTPPSKPEPIHPVSAVSPLASSPPSLSPMDAANSPKELAQPNNGSRLDVSTQADKAFVLKFAQALYSIGYLNYQDREATLLGWTTKDYAGDIKGHYFSNYTLENMKSIHRTRTFTPDAPVKWLFSDETTEEFMVSGTITLQGGMNTMMPMTSTKTVTAHIQIIHDLAGKPLVKKINEQMSD
jgi:hypothetical protein